MPHNTLAIACTFFILLASCKKSETKPQDDFSCIKLTDEIGQGLGLSGCVNSNDWGHTTLSSAEAAYFTGNDDTFLQGTVSVAITEMPQFPNPVMPGSDFRVHLVSPSSNNPVKLQLAIIDASKNILYQYVGNVNTNSSIDIAVPEDKFTKGAYYRVYYRVSAQGAPILFEGHSNFLVCKQTGPVSTVSDCL